MLQSDKKGKKNQIGAWGEAITGNYLRKQGFVIEQQNYLKKWGEIDLIASKSDAVHFVEVKTVSYETKEQLQNSVSRETYRPEENVHPKKLQRMYRAIETWLAERVYDGEWQIDIAAVRLVESEKYATIKYIANIIE